MSLTCNQTLCMPFPVWEEERTSRLPKAKCGGAAEVLLPATKGIGSRLASSKGIAAGSKRGCRHIAMISEVDISVCSPRMTMQRLGVWLESTVTVSFEVVLLAVPVATESNDKNA